MKNLILTVIAVCSLNTIQAQEISYKKWVKEAPRLEDSFFTTPKAKEVAETVLLYQQPTGGWPKNINFFQTPDNKEKALEIKNDVNASTIDNGATTTEIIYLSRLYNA